MLPKRAFRWMREAHPSPTNTEGYRFFESGPLYLCVSMIPLGKPVSTFPDHARGIPILRIGPLYPMCEQDTLGKPEPVFPRHAL